LWLWKREEVKELTSRSEDSARAFCQGRERGLPFLEIKRGVPTKRGWKKGGGNKRRSRGGNASRSIDAPKKGKKTRYSLKKGAVCSLGSGKTEGAGKGGDFCNLLAKGLEKPYCACSGNSLGPNAGGQKRGRVEGIGLPQAKRRVKSAETHTQENAGGEKKKRRINLHARTIERW